MNQYANKGGQRPPITTELGNEYTIPVNVVAVRGANPGALVSLREYFDISGKLVFAKFVGYAEGIGANISSAKFGIETPDFITLGDLFYGAIGQDGSVAIVSFDGTGTRVLPLDGMPAIKFSSSAYTGVSAQNANLSLRFGVADGKFEFTYQGGVPASMRYVGYIKLLVMPDIN